MSGFVGIGGAAAVSSATTQSNTRSDNLPECAFNRRRMRTAMCDFVSNSDLMRKAVNQSPIRANRLWLLVDESPDSAAVHRLFVVVIHYSQRVQNDLLTSFVQGSDNANDLESREGAAFLARRELLISE